METGLRRIQILTDTIRRLLRRRATVNLVKIIKKTHSADLALVFNGLSHKDSRTLFELLPDVEAAAEVLAEMSEPVREDFLEELAPERLARIFQEMSTDDAAMILDEVDDEQRKAQILELMKDEDSDEVEELLSYGENTAGRIMSPDYFALPEDTEAGDAIRELRKASEAEMVFYIYVTNAEGKLVGVLSLRQLVTVPPETKLGEIMEEDVVHAHAHEDQEDVARLVARYNILALPVVDQDERIIGIVTVDDVIDVMRDEATEDLMKLVGTREEEISSTSAFRSAQIRLPWLFASWVGGLIAARVIEHFNEAIAQMAALAAFIPVVVGMGGNIGIQSTTITVRALATHRLEPGRFLRYILKEVGVGVLLGVAYGVLLGVASALLYHGNVELGLATGLGILTSMILASIMGTALPLFFHRIGVDPAVASGPFVTTTIDILGVGVYFVIATAIIL
ncbi:MAG: magnesium transporter [Alphaproteobacteria bacterium]